jgi:hypothetical protein
MKEATFSKTEIFKLNYDLSENIIHVKIINLYEMSYIFYILFLFQLLTFDLRQCLKKFRKLFYTIKYINHGFC